MPKSRDVEVGERLLAHAESRTTDLSDVVTRLPVSYYLDPARWQREMDRIFKRLPLLLAFSCELREEGAYKALDVIGVPVLLMRGSDGAVRAFLNVCSHRGSRLKPEGSGQCRRLVCPYHAWAYDDRGALVRINQAHTFGELDLSTRGLTELPCEEKAGLVFAILTPALPIDVARYLGGMLDDLSTLGIADWHVYARRELVSANWKATHDGYVDGYHLASLHPKTVGLISKANCNTFDAFGPHQRIGFANLDIEKLRDKPTEEWEQDEGFGFVRTLFPNVSFAARTGAGGLVSQLLPGPTPDRSRTLQTFLRARLPQTEEDRRRADAEVELFYTTVRDEDYRTVDGVQQGLESGAIDEVVFGKNELGNQRLHRWIEFYSRDDPRDEDRPNPAAAR
jgi:phenylpropionate dioxygenase-like ring-hydroxylating dioxygenase large terminal subunit